MTAFCWVVEVVLLVAIVQRAGELAGRRGQAAAAAAALLVVAVLLAGCGPAAGPGTVTDRRLLSIGGAAAWRLQVRQNSDGTTVQIEVGRTVYARCPVGARWPECAAGGAR